MLYVIPTFCVPLGRSLFYSASADLSQTCIENVEFVPLSLLEAMNVLSALSSLAIDDETSNSAPSCGCHF